MAFINFLILVFLIGGVGELRRTRKELERIRKELEAQNKQQQQDPQYLYVTNNN